MPILMVSAACETVALAKSPAAASGRPDIVSAGGGRVRPKDGKGATMFPIPAETIVEEQLGSA